MASNNITTVMVCLMVRRELMHSAHAERGVRRRGGWCGGGGLCVCVCVWERNLGQIDNSNNREPGPL